MKTILINPPDLGSQFEWRSAQPLGIAYVAAVLEQNSFHVSLLDADVGRKMTIREIADLVEQGSFEVVGISALSNLFSTCLAIAKEVKERDEGIFVVLGGIHATVFHKQILEKFSQIDAIVRGEGELTMLRLVEALEDGESPKDVQGVTFKSEGRISINPPSEKVANLDQYPFPARHLLPPLEEYSSSYFEEPELREDIIIGTVLSSRGCPRGCSFCIVPVFCRSQIGPVWRARSPQNVVEEIEELVGLGADHISFVDNDFLIDPKRALLICRMLKAIGPEVSFNFQTRSDEIVTNEKAIIELKEQGCIRLEVGFESGSENVLTRFKKGCKVEVNSEAIRILQKCKMDISPFFIMFDPHTTIDELNDTLRFIERHSLMLHGANFMRVLYPIPGTPIYSSLLSEGAPVDAYFNIEWAFKNKDVENIWRMMSVLRTSYEEDRRRMLSTVYQDRKTIEDLLLGVRMRGKNQKLRNLWARYNFCDTTLKLIPYYVFRKSLQTIETMKETEFRETMEQYIKGLFEKQNQEISLSNRELTAWLKNTRIEGKNEKPDRS